MTRIKSPRKTKRRSLLSATKGYRKPANNSFKIAHQRFLKAQVHAFRDRHKKKQVFRHLWISRLNAFLRYLFMINYSTFISKLKKVKILLNRKSMAQLAVYDWFFFEYLVKVVDDSTWESFCKRRERAKEQEEKKNRKKAKKRK